MPSSLSAYTPLESLLLLIYLAAFGFEPCVFSRISDFMISNHFIRSCPTFDQTRLESDALKNLYLHILKNEAKAGLLDSTTSTTLTDFSLDNTMDPSCGNIINTNVNSLDINYGSEEKKSSLNLSNFNLSCSEMLQSNCPSLSFPSAQDAAQHMHLISQLIVKLYARFREATLQEIRLEERRYLQIQKDLDEIKHGLWDVRLQREIDRGDWKYLQSQVAAKETLLNLHPHHNGSINGQTNCNQESGEPIQPTKFADSDNPSQHTAKSFVNSNLSDSSSFFVQLPSNLSTGYISGSSNSPESSINNFTTGQPSLGYHVPGSRVSPASLDLDTTGCTSQKHDEGITLGSLDANPSGQSGSRRNSSSASELEVSQSSSINQEGSSVTAHASSDVTRNSVEKERLNTTVLSPILNLHQSPVGANNLRRAQDPLTPKLTLLMDEKTSDKSPVYESHIGESDLPTEQKHDMPITAALNDSSVRDKSPSHGLRGERESLTVSAGSKDDCDMARRISFLLRDTVKLNTGCNYSEHPIATSSSAHSLSSGDPTDAGGTDAIDVGDSRSVSPLTDRHWSPPPFPLTNSVKSKKSPPTKVERDVDSLRSIVGYQTRARCGKTLAATAATTSGTTGGSNGDIAPEYITDEVKTEEYANEQKDPAKDEIAEETAAKTSHTNSSPAPSQTRQSKRKRSIISISDASDTLTTASEDYSEQRNRDSSSCSIPQQSKIPMYVLATRNFPRLSNPVMNTILSLKHASMFTHPVKDSVAEGYSEIIKRPQDIKNIKAAIQAGARAVTLISSISSSANGETSSPSTSPFIQLPLSIDLIPPRGIVNSSQLERELVRMLANAVMFSPGEDGVVRDAREMFETVSEIISAWRDVERDIGNSNARRSSSAGASIPLNKERSSISEEPSIHPTAHGTLISSSLTSSSPTSSSSSPSVNVPTTRNHYERERVSLRKRNV